MDPVGDGQQHRLDRRQPHREGPGKVLDEDPDEALQGTQDHPVQHHRAVLAAVGPHVGEVETLRQGEIALDGGALPAAVHGVLELDVDLGAVKGAFALADVIREIAWPPWP